jgi:hypothetical protein
VGIAIIPVSQKLALPLVLTYQQVNQVLLVQAVLPMALQEEYLGIEDCFLGSNL